MRGTGWRVRWIVAEESEGESSRGRSEGVRSLLGSGEGRTGKSA